MNRFLFAAALFFLVPAPAFADASLFLLPEEATRLDALLAEKHQQAPASPKDQVHLGAILYADQTDWSLWLQGERWTQDRRDAKIRILAVTPHTVTLAVLPPDGGAEVKLTLAPNQSYRFSTGTIEEGRN